MFSGPNRARNGSGGQRIVVELLDEGIAADTFEVDLGGPLRRTPSGGPAGDPAPTGLAWKILAGVAVLGVLIGAIVWMQSDAQKDDSAESAPSTTLPSSTTRGPLSFEVSTTTTTPSPAATVVPPTFVVNGGQPIVNLGDPTAGDLGVFLVDENNRDEVYRLDIRDGVISSWATDDTGTGDVLAMVDTAEGAKPIRARSRNGWTVVWPLPDGTYWETADDGVARLRDGMTGDAIRELAPPWQTSGLDWTGLSGISATGDPVVWGPDNRQYAIAADGSASLFADAPVSSLTNGSYAVVACLEDGNCSWELRTPVGTYVDTLPPQSQQWDVMFSPDGRYAVDERFEGVVMKSYVVDLAAGTRTEVAVGDGMLNFETRSGEVHRLVWTPDARFFFGRRHGSAGEPGSLMILEAATGVVTEVALPAEIGPVMPIAVM